MKVGQMVQIHQGENSMGGIFINEKFITGKIVKVNQKSIRVHMTHIKHVTNGQVTKEQEMDETATFTYWKTVDRQFGKNAGKKVDIYRNKKYGLIEIVH